jgi:hypothetical protein
MMITLERLWVSGGRMSERLLRRRLRGLLRSMDIQPPLRADELCQRLGQLRDRPVVLVPTQLEGAGAFGALIPMRRKDLIIYQDGLDPKHRDTIVFHEFSHLFLEHIQSARAEGKALVCNIGALDSFGDATVYDLREEWEAETCAAILSEWADLSNAIAPTRSVGNVLERTVQRGLGGSDWV